MDNFQTYQEKVDVVCKALVKGFSDIVSHLSGVIMLCGLHVDYVHIL